MKCKRLVVPCTWNTGYRPKSWLSLIRTLSARLKLLLSTEMISRFFGQARPIVCAHYSLSNSRVVFSVTLGGCASSFVLTCCRPTPGIGMFAAGGKEPYAGADPRADV